jgi:hypothetical protein
MKKEKEVSGKAKKVVLLALSIVGVLAILFLYMFLLA